MPRSSRPRKGGRRARQLPKTAFKSSAERNSLYQTMGRLRRERDRLPRRELDGGEEVRRDDPPPSNQ